MTLIKCSHCGHTVLSVASHCPACSRPLGQTFLGLEHEGALSQCRSCGHQVRTRTRVCPNCGAQDPARWPRAARSALAAALGVAVVVLLALIASGKGLPNQAPRAAPATTPREAARPETAATRTTPADTPSTASARARHAAPLAADSAPRQSADSAAAQRLAAAARREQPEEPAATEASVAAPPAPTLRSSTLQTRWTTVWVNVRGGPSNTAPVVRVLAPGTAVRGAEGKWGWWAVRLGGDTVGYIAGELLSNRQPGTN